MSISTMSKATNDALASLSRSKRLATQVSAPARSDELTTESQGSKQADRINQDLLISHAQRQAQQAVQTAVSARRQLDRTEVEGVDISHAQEATDVAAQTVTVDASRALETQGNTDPNQAIRLLHI
jgi:GH25 family lysozyme M1 (1,4-beta-N-acetylmuramidase)